MMSTHPSRVITYRKTEKESVRTKVNQKVSKHQYSDNAWYSSLDSISQDPAALLFPLGLGEQQCVTKGLA